jgi:hypothetical protein
MPRVHHHVADEAHMKRVGDALPKWLGVILRVCINGLSRLAAGNAGNGAGKRPRPPLSVQPGLSPDSLLTTETVIALQSLLLRLMNTNYTRSGRQCQFLNDNKAIKSDGSADFFNRSWTARLWFLAKNDRLLDYFLDPSKEPRITLAVGHFDRQDLATPVPVDADGG